MQYAFCAKLILIHIVNLVDIFISPTVPYTIISIFNDLGKYISEPLLGNRWHIFREGIALKFREETLGSTTLLASI